MFIGGGSNTSGANVVSGGVVPISVGNQKRMPLTSKHKMSRENENSIVQQQTLPKQLSSDSLPLKAAQQQIPQPTAAPSTNTSPIPTPQPLHLNTTTPLPKNR